MFGHFNSLMVPFSPELAGDVVGSGNVLYIAVGSDLYSYDELQQLWRPSVALPGVIKGRMTVLANGMVACGCGVSPGGIALVDPVGGLVILGDVFGTTGVPGCVQKADGQIVAATTNNGYVDKLKQYPRSFWGAGDGLIYSLLGQISPPGYGTWFISQARDSSGRIWAGGEAPDDPAESSDGGLTWHNIGCLLGGNPNFGGNTWGTLQLPDGTLLVQRLSKLANGHSSPICRGLSGGPWTQSGPGLNNFQDAMALDLLPTGTILCGQESTGSGTAGQTSASYDNGNTWADLLPNGIPHVPCSAIAHTNSNAYVRARGHGILFAPLA